MLTVKLDLPDDLVQRLRAEGVDIESDVRTAFALDLFRRGVMSHYDLSVFLGLDRFETDEWRQSHNVTEYALNADELAADRKTGQDLMSKKA